MIFLIIGVAGAIGSGKSFTQLKHGLNYCEERQKQLVTNFPVNIEAIYRYAISPKILDFPFGSQLYELKKLWKIILYNLKLVLFSIGFVKSASCLNFSNPPRLPWVAKLCKEGGISQIFNPERLEALMIPESVILLDEAGIFLNSRDFQNTSKKLLSDLVMSRKDGCDLIWCAQFEDQVDKQFRQLTQFWIHCQSLSKYDRQMRRPKLLVKQIFWFSCADYYRWLADPIARGNYFKTRFAYSMQSEEGPLNDSDCLIFKCFDSFTRLDSLSSYHATKSFSLVNTIFKCNLPIDYYFNSLDCYWPQFDPFSRFYEPLYGYYSKSKSSSNESIIEFAKPRQEKSYLIRQALMLSRKKQINAPLFKNMSEAEIQSWIASVGGNRSFN